MRTLEDDGEGETETAEQEDRLTVDSAVEGGEKRFLLQILLYSKE